ncbi:MAG: M48 family metallopeptidase [Muribaculaceae bacterium]|nr:M48 family metallopeptidase [Muribaculaceae bacterium]
MFYLDDKEFGKVFITMRSNMRNITMRWKGGSLYMNVPLGTQKEHLEKVLNEMRPKLRQSQTKNELSYHIGQEIECYGFKIVIGEQTKFHDRIIFSKNDNVVIASVPHGIDLTTHSSKEWVSKALKTVARNEATRLLPLAQSVAARLGVAPERFEIGRGLRKLGHCTPKRVIQLSANLVFLPEDLIEYIICHELAHLTHMNHSPQFHALVNKYVNGQEKALERKLRAFQWPVIR